VAFPFGDAAAVCSPLRGRVLGSLEHPRVDSDTRDDIDYFAALRPRPVSLKEILGPLEPGPLAKFIVREVPVRYAERIRWIEEIPDWELIPQLQEVHRRHVRCFVNLRRVHGTPDLEDLTIILRRSVRQTDDAMLLGAAMQRLHRDRGEAYGSLFADRWLDKFLLNQIGSCTLMMQYIALRDYLVEQRGVSTGIVDELDVRDLCRRTAVDVLDITEMETGHRPIINVEAFSVDKTEPSFSYVPCYLSFIVREVLKNSCLATTDAEDVPSRPINVMICADQRQVAIRVSDRGGGIPFDVGQRIWSYLYSTRHGAENRTPTALAGCGVGLPRARLYARYLGGSLDVVSWPGYGVDAHIFLPRLPGELVEFVPDDDDDDSGH